MIASNSCKESIQNAIDNKYFSIAHLYKEEQTMDMHIHDCYEIYFSISGAHDFLINQKNYLINPGDVFVINQFESHHVAQLDKEVHNRIVISIHPRFLEELSLSDADLTYCFTHRPENFSNQLSLTKEQQQRFLYYVNHILTANDFGHRIIERSKFSELMLLLTEICMNSNEAQELKKQTYYYNNVVDDIMKYIHQNIAEPINVEALASHFFISSSYICRIFKKSTGVTITNYIISRRISLSKSLLASGKNVNEVYALCGFNDYSNFFKAFTKSVGISPKKYAQNCLS